MTTNKTRSIEERLFALALDTDPRFLERVVARWATVQSPVGDVYVAWTKTGICAVASRRAIEDSSSFVDVTSARLSRPLLKGEPSAAIVDAMATGRSRQLRFDLAGLTPFETDVLETTRRIPRGEVRPYAWVAAEIGRPRAVRAVGSALGRNPVPLLIPCHRVTRSDGSIGNYGSGGPEMKEELLRAEEVNLDEVLELARAGVHFVGATTTRVVCFPSCTAIRRAAPARRQGFRSLDEAEAVGFRPCERCRPGIAASA